MSLKLTTDTELTTIANAIREKSGTNESLIYPNGFVSAISNINSGGSGKSVASNDVNFYDYDGTIVYSYSAADFANITSLPTNPDNTSDGLIAQGWNWTLSDAKTYVAAYGRLDIGQMYVTTDGKTHVHIHLEQGRTSPMLGVCPNGTVDVDWGDGTTHDTLTGTSTTTVQWTNNHNYATPGDYVIKLTVSEGGSMGFYGGPSNNQGSGLLRYSSSGDNRNYVYRNAIRAVFIGSGVTSIRSAAFYNCYNLANVMIPSNVTSIGDNAFYSCYSLSSVMIPNSVTNIGNSAFSDCYSLSSVIIPSSVTSIGTYAFRGCSSLLNMTILSNVTSIGDNAFYSCYSLSSVTIPSDVTSIGSSSFYDCYSLSSVTIPSDVTSIGTYAFRGCYGLSELHFKPETPPTVSNSSDAFAGIPTDCKIYVPTGKLASYTSANNYPSSSTYTYVEE